MCSLQVLVTTFAFSLTRASGTCLTTDKILPKHTKPHVGNCAMGLACPCQLRQSHPQINQATGSRVIKSMHYPQNHIEIHPANYVGSLFYLIEFFQSPSSQNCLAKLLFLLLFMPPKPVISHICLSKKTVFFLTEILFFLHLSSDELS